MTIFKSITALVLLLGALVILGVFGHLRGWWLPSLTHEELSAQLRPHDHIFVPEGVGPFPTVLLFHGCGGLGEGRLIIADRIRSWGYAVIAVDSAAARDLPTGGDAPMCRGSRALGPERAGDALVSIADARRMSFVDPERIALVGYSHGGWTLMELLAFDPPRALPASLSTSTGEGLQGVRGIGLYYPYCGFASLGNDWRPAIPTLFLLGAEDRIADPAPCIEAAKALETKGLPIRVRVFDSAQHGFDVPSTATHRNLGYSELAARESERAFRAFLDDVMR